MNFWETIFQAIIQGLTEFLPVSSSGHLSLIQHFTGNAGEEGLLLSIALHTGTLLAVILAFWKTVKLLFLDFFKLIGKIFTGKCSFKNTQPGERMILMLLLSLVPAVIIIVFKDFFESFSSDSDIIVEGFSFLITATLLFMADKAGKGNTEMGSIRPRQATTVGLAQVLAALPGVSRSGSTVTAGILSGFNRELAVTYSFILGIPAVLAASLSMGLDIAKGKSGVVLTSADVLIVLVGVLVSAVVGFFAIRLVRWLIVSNRFKIFAYYTLVLGSITLILGFLELILAKRFMI